MFKAFSAGAIGVSAGFERSVELAASYGFEGVYTDTAYLMEKGPEAVRGLLEGKGIRAAGWGLPVAFAEEDEDKFRESLGRLEPICERCAAIGDLRTSTYVLSFSDERPFDKQSGLLGDRFAKIGEILARYGIRLGLEFLGPQTLRRGHAYEFIHTMEGMLELCEAVGTGNMGLLLDCWHLYTSGGAMDDVLKLEDEDVVNVHINDAPAGVPLSEQIDNVRGLPGETGVIDVRGFLAALKKIGYSGPVMAEPFSQRVREMPDPEAILATKQAMDSIWPQ